MTREEIAEYNEEALIQIKNRYERTIVQIIKK